MYGINHRDSFDLFHLSIVVDLFPFFLAPLLYHFFRQKSKNKKIIQHAMQKYFLISTIPLSNTPACHIDIGIPKWYFGALAPLCCFCIIPKKNKRRQEPWEKLKVNRAELYFLLVIAFFSSDSSSCIISFY